mgnify:CR=1 FL=1
MEIALRRCLAQRGGTEPAPYRGPEALVVGCAWGVAFASQSLKRNLGRRGVVTPPYGSTTGDAKQRTAGSSAPTDRRGSSGNHPGQRRTAERLRRGCEGMGGNRGRDHPQRGQQFRAIPQSPFRRQLPLHKGAFGDGGCGLPRRFAPRNDSPDPLSFRGGPTGRRGNPSFLRWTGVRAAEVVGPYAPRGKGERHAGVVVPYGWSQGGLINCRGSA